MIFKGLMYYSATQGRTAATVATLNNPKKLENNQKKTPQQRKKIINYKERKQLFTLSVLNQTKKVD